MKRSRFMTLVSLLVLVSLPSAAEEKRIVSIGSDTMSPLIEATVTAFKKLHPDLVFEQQDPGSLPGFMALTNGKTDICPAARSMRSEEVKAFEERNNGARPIQIRVASTGVLIYVNRENPIGELNVEQLGRIFAQSPDQPVVNVKTRKNDPAIGSKLSTWGAVDPKLPSEWTDAKIRLCSRNAASVTYSHFKSQVLTNHEVDGTAEELPGTSAVMSKVGSDKFAIGYSVAGYLQSGVKVVPISPGEGKPAVLATGETVASKAYPIAIEYYIIVAKKPEGIVREYLEFLLSPAGQKIVAEQPVSFVPLSQEQAAVEREKLK